jgi:hypothetical protein
MSMPEGHCGGPSGPTENSGLTERAFSPWGRKDSAVVPRAVRGAAKSCAESSA